MSLVDKWAYFFREAENLTAIPDALALYCPVPYLSNEPRSAMPTTRRCAPVSTVPAGLTISSTTRVS
jgi:hypothetical protein